MKYGAIVIDRCLERNVKLCIVKAYHLLATSCIGIYLRYRCYNRIRGTLRALGVKPFNA